MNLQLQVHDESSNATCSIDFDDVWKEMPHLLLRADGTFYVIWRDGMKLSAQLLAS